MDEHWKAVKRIERYLRGTSQLGLNFTRPRLSTIDLALVGFSDADWATSPDDRKSTTGYCVFLAPNLITWSAKKQHTVSRSSTEAEYRSLAAVTAEITWIESLLHELNFKLPKPPTVWCDNLSTLAMSNNSVLHARTKHIELDLYFVRDKVLQKQLIVNHVPSIDQIADVFTKPLSTSRFQILRDKLTVVEPQISLREDVNHQKVNGQNVRR